MTGSVGGASDANRIWDLSFNAMQHYPACVFAWQTGGCHRSMGFGGGSGVSLKIAMGEPGAVGVGQSVGPAVRTDYSTRPSLHFTAGHPS